MQKRLASYEEFWPFYVAQHRNPTNRALHFVGTSLVIACGVAGFSCLPSGSRDAVRRLRLRLGGSLRIREERPATFTYPLWSLRGRLPDVPSHVARAHGPRGATGRRAFPAGA